MTASRGTDRLLTALEKVRVLALGVVEPEGSLSEANEGLIILVGGPEQVGQGAVPLRLLRPDPTWLLQMARSMDEGREVYRGPITLRGPEGRAVSIVGRFHGLDGSLLLVGEPPGRTGEAVAERLATLHGELAEKTRKLKDEIQERDRLATQREQDRAWLAALEREAEVERFGREVLNLIGHQLGTPLTPLRFALHTLHEQGLDEEGRAAVERMERNVSRLEETTSQVLQAVEVAKGLAGPRWEPVSLKELLAQVVADREPEARARGVTVEREIAPGLQLHGDPALVRRALDLLLTNAIDHTPRGKRVTVEAERAEAVVVVRVSDEGEGLSEEARAWVFKPFGRVQGEPVRTAAGPGLQLYTVRGIARAHGGSLTLEPSEEGRGATFVLSLPSNPRSR